MKNIHRMYILFNNVSATFLVRDRRSTEQFFGKTYRSIRIHYIFRENEHGLYIYIYVQVHIHDTQTFQIVAVSSGVW